MKREDVDKLIRSWSLDETLKHRCLRYAYVGSYRRGAEDVGDLDVLLCCDDRCWVELDDIFQSGGKLLDGDYRYKAYEIVLANPERLVKVELQRVTESIWGNALVYFTGPRAENERLRKVAWDRGWLWLKRGALRQRGCSFRR